MTGRQVLAHRVAVGDVVVLDRVACRVRAVTPVVRYGTRTRPVPDTDRIRYRIEGRPVTNPNRPTRTVTVAPDARLRVPA